MTKRRARSLLQIFVTYVVFQVLYWLNTMLAFHMNGFDIQTVPGPLNPDQQVVTWFLLALVCWRLVLPLLAQMRRPLTISLVVGHLAVLLDLGVNHQNVLAFLVVAMMLDSTRPPSSILKHWCFLCREHMLTCRPIATGSPTSWLGAISIVVFWTGSAARGSDSALGLSSSAA